MHGVHLGQVHVVNLDEYFESSQGYDPEISILVDTSYGGSFFATLWTFYKVYSIQMPRTHYKIINLTKLFMD
jgi:hypothetical protein